MIVIKDDDVIETNHCEDYIIIKVKSLKNISYVDLDKKKEQKIKNWQEFWSTFVTDFLSQDFLNGIKKEQKKEITDFIKDKLKTEIL